MLQFNKLVLTGFKSFVEPTELLIEPGISAVVGPNGCGKSNLLEALRWVMGENSAKRMRGGEMDDVIFGGAEGRPARNLAEVKLVIDNSAHEAPAIFNEFDELEITRKIEREKGSQYRVNGKNNRARDVQLLFADAGSGAQSNSLVGQGRIGAIIGAKPTERRVLLEEAAGIAGLYSRRHEAELRLRAAETNLQRLDDIQETLHSQLRSLARQAKQAERYRALNEELRKLEATLFYIDWIAFGEALEEAKKNVREGQRLVGERTQEASAAERQAINANATIKEAREQDAVKAAVLQRLEHERETLEAERKRQVGAREDLERQVSKLREDRMRESTLLEEAKSSILRLSDEQDDLKSKLEADQDLGSAAGEKVEKANALYTSEQADLDNLTQKKATADAERQSSRKAIYDLEKRISDVAQKQTKAKSDEETAQARLTALTASEPSTSEEELTGSLQTCDEDLAKLEENREATAEKLEQQRTIARDLESAQKAREAEARGLKAALASSNRPSGTSNLKPVLDQLTVEAGFEAALAAALGEDLDAPLYETGADRAWKGQTAFDFAADLPANLPSLAKFVTAPSELAARLAFTAVVDTAEQGQSIAQDLKPGQRLVSKDGAFWRWDGYFEAKEFQGAASLAETRLTQRNRLQALDAEIEAEAPKISQASETQKVLAEERQTLEAKLGETRQTRRRLESELTQLRDQLSRSAAEKAQLSGLLDNLAQQTNELAATKAELDTSLSTQQSEIKDESELELLLTQINDKRAKVSEARLALSQAEGERDRLKYEQEQRQTRINAIQNELESWSQRQKQADNRQLDFHDRLAVADERLTKARNAPDEVSDKLTKLAVELDKATTARKEAGDTLALAETEQLRLSNAQRDAERALSDARENLVRSEAHVEQADERIQELVGRIRERLAVPPQRLLQIAEVEDPETLPPRKEADAQRQRALSQREAMGAVNLRAEQETEELRSELSKYETEREDVQSAVNTLREGIDELNAEGRTKLLAAFEHVSQHFTVLFKRLFGGGEAELRLVDSDDPLEAGLQVLASPPGKKMQILSLLSGGEQALTAMSLLFAVFMTKPAPVCVLDEVDAPLDDENCIRFCDLIRDMAEQTGTRFLVVTHNPHTMARVDRLFGVTMAEKGVSQLMSVNLTTAESLAKS